MAAQHDAFVLNTTNPDDKQKLPWSCLAQIGCIGLVASVLVPSKQSKFLQTSDEGMFVGYHAQPGFTYELLGLPLKSLPDKAQRSISGSIDTERERER